MPDPKTIERLRQSVLSAVSLKELQPDWTDAIVDEWLNFYESIITIAGLLDIGIDQKIEEISTDLPDDQLLVPDNGFLVSTGTSLTDIEARSFFLARIY